MRAFLDSLYRWSGGVAAFFIVAICSVVLLQVGANLIDAFAVVFTGQAVGLVIPSYAEFAGFFLAAASFLALAYTLRHGGHIRVSLVVQHLPSRIRHGLELWCLAVGAALAAYFAYFTIGLMLESLEYGDVSPGMVPVPLWAPQFAMAGGLIVLTIALVDEFQCVARGLPASYEGAGEGLLGQPDAPSEAPASPLESEEKG